MIQLRRERIAERIRALQELVPSVNKVSVSSLLTIVKKYWLLPWHYLKGIMNQSLPSSYQVCKATRLVHTSLSCRVILLHLQTDRATMVDEIVEYVKFLRLQVKVNNPRVCSGFQYFSLLVT